MRSAELAQAGRRPNMVCGRCGNRSHGPLCDRCQRELDAADAQLLRELRREKEGRRYAPR